MTIIVSGGVGLILINQQNQKKAPAVEVSATPTEAPTPTVMEIERGDFSFEVLNGSGEGGKAGRTADAIEALGYSIGNIGNADSSDYSGLQVGFSDEVSDEEKEIILKDLEKEFLGAEENEDIVPEDTDILVIVGK
jgi:hypothetical protein